MCVVCVTVAGTVVVASQITPIQVLSDFTSTQRTLTSFSGSSSALSTKQKSEIKTLVINSPDSNAVVCTGLTLKGASKTALTTARSRAKAACDYAKIVKPVLKTTLLTRTTAVRSNAGKVTVQVRTPSKEAALPEITAPIPSSPNWEVNLVSSSPEVCKLRENSRVRKIGDPNPNLNGEKEIMGRYPGNATAFPFAPTGLNVTGELNVHMIFIDWSDLPGTEADYAYYSEQLKLFASFYSMVSENKLDMKTTKSKSWFRAIGSYLDVSMLGTGDEAQQGEAPRKQLFYDAAVMASDASTDFSDVDIVLFAVPRAKSIFKNGPHIFNFIWNAYLKTNEGNIYNSASAGDWFLKSGETEPPWVYYVHEVGHMIGIPHQANEDLRGETPMWLQNPMNGYEIMANQGGASRTMSTWLRWLAGWLSDDQVICTEKSQITSQYFELSPINDLNSGPESLVIKIDDAKAVVVESRRFDERFDRRTRNSKNGVIVYTVDATKASAQGNQALVSPRDITRYIVEPNWRGQDELDAFFFQGDSAVVSGLRIEAVSVGGVKDVVRVTKAN